MVMMIFIPPCTCIQSNRYMSVFEMNNDDYEDDNGVNNSHAKRASGSETNSGIPKWPKIELSAEFKEDIRKAFRLFDVSGIGVIPVDSVKVAFRALGYDTTMSEMNELRSQTSDRNFQVDLGDFLKLMTEKMLALDSELEIIKSFELLDTDNKGYVDIDDLREAVKTLQLEDVNDDMFGAMLLGAQITDPAEELQECYEHRVNEARIRDGRTYGMETTVGLDDDPRGFATSGEAALSDLAKFEKARRLSSSNQPTPGTLTVNLKQFRNLMEMTRPPLDDIVLI